MVLQLQQAGVSCQTFTIPSIEYKTEHLPKILGTSQLRLGSGFNPTQVQDCVLLQRLYDAEHTIKTDGGLSSMSR